MTKEIPQLIAQMTLEEKASLCSGANFWHMQGIERLGIPSIMITDGPHGLRKQDTSSSDHVGLNESVPAICFPTASALAATWNRDLLYEVGAALGDECRAEKVGVILGPGANIKRSPLCGRNFEYFSEDPFLSGEMAISHINGTQGKGIGTSLKHYVVNNQEYRRMTIDAVVDERALHEIYLTGFEMAVKEAQPWTVMCAYNRVNGTYACQHKELMTDILKEEWGHEGLVVTDWGAMNDRVAGLAAGVELEMPGTKNGNDAKIVEAVRVGELDEAVLDVAVTRILQLIFKAKTTLANEASYDAEEHHALARRVAGEGAVLLKNEGGLLPLAGEGKVAIIGRFAKEPRYQGAGSSLINPTKVDNLYDELGKLVDEEQLAYAAGYTQSGNDIDQSLIDEAVGVAKTADFVIICAGLTDMYEIEGLDREHMKLPPAHDALIDAIAAAHSNVIIVLSNGSPVEMPWINDVPVILEGYLGGQAGAGAIADILIGKVNPSGKLAETFPIRLEDNSSYHYFPSGPSTVEYRESIFVGYRYFDTVKQDVLFPFGHGLSYTSFDYSNLQLSHSQMGEDETLTVSLTVKNMGSVAGKETVQLYVRDVESSAFRPDKELKGFAKVELEPGEETAVMLTLNHRAFAFYSPAASDWVVESGQFEILVGASSQDIRLSGMVELSGQDMVASEQVPAVYHDFPKGTAVSAQDFAALLGRPLPPNKIDSKGNYTINTPFSELSGSFLGRQLNKRIQAQVDKLVTAEEHSPTAALMQAMIRHAPLRIMLMTADGGLTGPMLEALVKILNGKVFRGAAALIKAIRNK
ncbi:MAG: glycoside hydrolase family 3 C-terminal domain-containing protein [Chloroflexota bacterium]